MGDWFTRMVMAPEGDGGGGNGGDGDKGSDGDGDGKGAGDGGGKEPAKVEMTQADLDAMVASRADRAERGAAAKAAKDAGFDSIEAMQTAAKAHQEREAAEKTELEKAQGDADTAKRNLEIRDAELNRERISNAFLVAATGASIPADRIGDALALSDLAQVTVGDDGVVTGIEAAVTAVVESKPWLLGKAAPAKGGNGGSGADGGARGDDTDVQRVSDEQALWGGKLGVPRDRIAASLHAGSGGETERTEYATSVRDREAEARNKTK